MFRHRSWIQMLFLLAGCLVSCASGARQPVGHDGVEESLQRLNRENTELQTKVDDLVQRMLRLSQQVEDQQVKLDFLADKVHSLEMQRMGGNPMSSPTPAAQISQSPAQSKNTTQSPGAQIERRDVDPVAFYEDAYKDYAAGRYQDAIIKFGQFLSLFPDNTRASNSQYWIGESYYSLKEYQNALRSFENVLQKYPISGKIPDAMVKKGLCYRKLGQDNLAEVEFHKIIDQFPTSSAAEIARKELEVVSLQER